MADSSRVEELRKRYHENPRRFFAPLANEYRKTGFLDRALLLCEKHLGEQPGNMNGLIVYGQTLFESGRHADAKGPFEAALQLDPENLIALRHLGDIARLSGDPEAARGWYQRVLEFDRRNDEVMELLVQVGGAVREPASGPSARASTIRVAPTVTASAVEPPPERPRTPVAPSTPPQDPAFHSAKTVEVTPRPRPTPLAEAETLEIVLPPEPAARPRTPTPATAPRTPTPAAVRRPPTPRSATPPAPRASLLDIDFDFSDTAAGGTPVVPPPSAVPEMPSVPETPSSPAGLTWESEPAIELPPESVAARASEPIIDLPPEPVTLGDVPVVEGLQVAEFSADVAPLSGLEPGEFESAGTPTEQLSDLEPSSFDSEGLAAGGLEGLETTEFEAPSAALSSLPDLESEGSLVGVPGAHAAAPTDAGGFPSLDGPLDEVPALEAPTDQPPALDLPLDEPLFLEPPAPARAGALPDTDLDFELEGEAAPPAASPAIVTETMATLYLSQGFRAQAIEVYRQLVAQDPADGTLREKLASLEAEEAAAQEPTSGPPPAPRVSMEFDTPPEGTAPAEEPPANAMLAEMSFAGVALDTPVSSGRVPTPVATLPAPAAGPTAREFLSGFVQRRATPSGAPAEEPNYAIPASLSPLDQLFGIEASAEDQRAANRLAAIGTTSAPSGGSVLDGLFTIGAPAAPAPRPSVPRASEKLKFDQFFSASSSPAAGTRPATPAPEPSSAQPPGEDDLDQFQGWLRGLTP